VAQSDMPKALGLNPSIGKEIKEGEQVGGRNPEKQVSSGEASDICPGTSVKTWGLGQGFSGSQVCNQDTEPEAQQELEV
jgi:hypothetical protein